MEVSALAVTGGPKQINPPPVPGIDRLYAIHEVAALTSLSKATVHRLYKSGRFPAPIVIGPRRVAWRASTIAQWIDARPLAGQGPG
jgi:prophage regulatory protein